MDLLKANGTIMKHFSCIVLIFIGIFSPAFQYPEQGKFDFVIKGHYGPIDQVIAVTKSQYAGSEYVIEVLCTSDSKQEISIKYSWYLRKAACWKEYFETQQVNAQINDVFDALQREGKELANETAFYMTASQVLPCDEQSHFLSSTKEMLKTQAEVEAEAKQQKAKSLISKEESKILSRMRRLDDVKNSSVVKPSVSTFFVVPYDGIYQLVLGSRAVVDSSYSKVFNASYDIAVSMKIRSKSGYISAADSPLRIFYAVMCAVYVLFAVAWLVVCFLRWRELLRVQYWIGAVIFLGMIEKAVFLSEYDAINKTGSSVSGLIVFAELVSCAKRTLSRLLVIIVSYGFGIVKPRLGVVLNRIVVVGFVYFILASFEGCYRVLMPKNVDENYSKKLMFAIIPLAVMESGICWWVFTALWSTTRTLQLRKNTIKLNLFRHFTHVLVFAVASSVVFMVWSMKHLNYDLCLSDWKQLWVNDAFWHVLFAIILASIMILWRPTNNNQRFAFSPLLDEDSDAEDEEEQEKLMADVSDTMKLRATKSSTSSSPRDSRSIDDELRWAEENIPSSAIDTGIPALDSDEEVLLARFEMSKMQ